MQGINPYSELNAKTDKTTEYLVNMGAQILTLKNKLGVPFKGSIAERICWYCREWGELGNYHRGNAQGLAKQFLQEIKDEQTLKYFLEWIDKIEHEIFQVPRPDVIFYFDIPFELRKKLKDQAVAEGKHTGKADVAEADQEHQRLAEERARQIVSVLNNWNKIDCCTDDGELRTREDIHEEVYKLALEVL